MYNTDRKTRWIEKKDAEVISSLKYYETKMNNVAPYEKELGKDLCEFTKSEIVDMYKSMNTYSPSTIYINNRIYLEYTDWCITEGFVPDSQNHFSEITRDMCNEYVNKTAFDKRIVTREEITDWCKACWNDADRYLLLGLFEGIKGNRFIDFTDTEVDDIENNVIHLASGRTLDFSEELISYAYKSAEETVWTSYTSEWDLPLANSNLILKPTERSRKTETINLTRAILKRSKIIFSFLGVGDYMSMNAVRISGMIDYININASRLGMSAQDYIKVYQSRIEERYMPINGFYNKYKDYLI